MSPLDAVVVEAVYEACRQEAIDSGRPIVPELFQQRDEAFQVQFCRTMERLLAPDYAGTPEAEHESWIRAYEKMGWRYGPERDPVAKTHPDMVPFGQLSEAERQKDAIFMACCSVARVARTASEAREAELVKASTDMLAIVEIGYDPGLHHMDTLNGRAAWIDRMKPVRERLRAVLASVKEGK